MDQEEAEAPPPYSTVDPLLAQANSRNGSGTQGANSVRENGASSQDTGSSRLTELPASAATVVPAHFASAATYFEEHPPPVFDESRGLLHHHMTIYPRSQGKDFPRRPRCWATRRDEIAQQDWDTFLRYLFPAQLGLAASSQYLPRQLRAEIQRDRKDRPQETDEQRHARISTVVDEWNQCFFEPRATCIVFVYVGEPDAAPSSALCPRCYPAATKATQGSGVSGSVEGQPGVNPNAPSPVAGQHVPSPNSWPMPPFPPFANQTPPPMSYGAPYGVPPFAAPGALHNGQPPQYYPHPPPHPGFAPWQWNNWGYTPPQFGPSGTSKSGALGWISSLTSQAQKYGERFAEQAQHYGDQIGAHAMHYGRQVEEQALARGRWIEDQARLHGQKPGAYPPGYPPGGYDGQPPWSPAQTDQTGAMYNTPTLTTPTTNPNPLNNTETRTQDQSQPQSTDIPTERSRRSSISSTSSESSLSSIDSLSTTSDLHASDLAAARTQLQSLEDRHDRTLYDAAVDLRHQLSVLQISRREARISGRRDWRQRQPQQPDSNDWGRWESPEQQQRNSTERRVMKEEMRATKKAFRDVVRRAREEQRDQRRARKNRRRHARAPLSGEDDKITDQAPLNRQMDHLALDDSAPRPVARSHTEPVAQAFNPPPQRAPVRSETSSEMSVPGVVHASSASQTSAHELPAEVPDKKTKFRQLLRSRNAKKQQQPQQPQQPQRSGTGATSADVDVETRKVAPKKDPGGS